MKWKDHNLSAKAKDMEIDRLHEKLGTLDEGSPEYLSVTQAVNVLEDSLQTRIQTRNQDLEGRVPKWALWLAGVAASIGVFEAVNALEKGDGVFSGQATAVWDRATRMFMTKL